jgi:hypothetical protein
MPSSRQLRAVREAIARDATPFDRLFRDKAFSRLFPGGFAREKVATRPPRGFDPTHPRLDWLKLQGFYVWRSYSRREFASAEFPMLVARDFKQVLRLNELLEAALAGQTARPRPVSGLLGRLEEIEIAHRKMDF